MAKRIEETVNGVDLVRVYDESGAIAIEQFTYNGVLLAREYGEGGQIKETYAVKGRIVSKASYEKARLRCCIQMPEANSEWDHIGKIQESLKGNKKTDSIASMDNKKSINGGCFESLIKDGTNIPKEKNRLGLVLADKSKRETSILLGKLWRAGALSMTALGAEKLPEGLFVSAIVVELPKEIECREKLLGIIAALATEGGFDTPADLGQHYEIIKVD